MKYILSELLVFPLMCLAYALAGFIAKRIKPDGTLPTMWKWASTPQDPASMHSNLAIGDQMFWDEAGIQPLTHENRVKLCKMWIKRNPAYFVDYYFGVTVAGVFDIDQDQMHNLEWYGDESKGREYYIANRKFYEGTLHRKLTQDDGEYFEYWYVKRWTANHFVRIRLGWFLDNTIARPMRSGERRSLQFTISPWMRIE